MLSSESLVVVVTEALSACLSVQVQTQSIDIAIDSDELIVTVYLPCKQVLNELKSRLSAHPDIANTYNKITIIQKIMANLDASASNAIAGVKNIIAIASAKGGVGKSTTAANLALALTYEGAKVGLLDADIYGPSQPKMLGIEEKKPELVADKIFKPLTVHGMKVMSMGNLVDPNTAMIWRGPMATGALQQLLRNTQWGELDYLVIDMPPGTGDIQLTLAQTVPVSGIVIVTTPQEIALLDAKKGIEMFIKVKVPIIGIVENMSMHICSACGHHEAIFGENGGESLAAEYKTRLLGQLPLQLDIRENADSGMPSVVHDAHSPASIIYRQIALALAQDLAALSAVAQGPEITFEDN